jgi:hypothetical protein
VEHGEITVLPVAWYAWDDVRRSARLGRSGAPKLEGIDPGDPEARRSRGRRLRGRPRSAKRAPIRHARLRGLSTTDKAHRRHSDRDEEHATAIHERVPGRRAHDVSLRPY